VYRAIVRPRIRKWLGPRAEPLEIRLNIYDIVASQIRLEKSGRLDIGLPEDSPMPMGRVNGQSMAW
jgi:hypothetical protein